MIEINKVVNKKINVIIRLFQSFIVDFTCWTKLLSEEIDIGTVVMASLFGTDHDTYEVFALGSFCTSEVCPAVPWWIMVTCCVAHCCSLSLIRWISPPTNVGTSPNIWVLSIPPFSSFANAKTWVKCSCQMLKHM